MKKPKNIPSPYQSTGTPIYRDTTSLPFVKGGPFNTAGPVNTLEPALSESEMRAKIAYEAALGNTAAQRMLSLNPKTYDFGDGNFGTHYMASFGNYAVPILQDTGKTNLEYIENPPPGKEDFKFTTPEQAEYFAENYKTVSPMSTKKYLDGGPLVDKTNHGKLLPSVYASALGNYYANGGMIKRADGSYSQRGLWDNIRANRGSGKEPTKQMLEQERKINREYRNGGQFPTPYSLPEDSFKQGGRNLHNSVYASSMAQYPAIYKYGGSFDMPRQQMYMPLDNVERYGGSILSMSNTPQLEGEGKDLTHPDGAYVYGNGGVVKTSHLFATGGFTDPPQKGIITYKSDPNLVNSTANFDMISKVPISQEYNEQIKHRLYTGNYGFNPETGELIALPKTKQVEVPAEIKNIRAKEEDTKAYNESVRLAGVGDPKLANPKTTWSDSQREEFIRQGFNKTVNNPAFKTAAYFTPVGAAIGSLEGMANLAPDLYKGDYTAAAFDAAEILPFIPKGFKTVLKNNKLARNTTESVDGFIQNLENITPSPLSYEVLDLDEIRSAYHNGDRILSMEEFAYLNKHGRGSAADYTTPPSNTFTREQQENAATASRWIHERNLDPSRLQDLVNRDENWRQIFQDYADVTSNRTAIEDYISGLSNQRPSAYSPSSFSNRVTSSDIGKTAPKPKAIVNKSGLTKEEVLAKAKDKEAISKMSEEEFQKTVLKPTGEIVSYETSLPSDKMSYDFNSGKMVLKDQANMELDQYANLFNENLDILNDIIAKKNTSGINYQVKELDPRGRLKFYTPAGQGVPEGTATWGVKINPGIWQGEVEDIANAEYLRSIPGIEMSNTLEGVFADAVPRRGTGTYESINEYLKLLGAGRVKPGFNSQTAFSRGLWENAVQKGKAVGFYNDPRVVYGTMKTMLPYVGIGGAAAVGLGNSLPTETSPQKEFKMGGQARVVKSSKLL